MSVATRRAIYGKMAGDNALTVLLASPPVGRAQSIYHQTAPAQAGFPFVIFQKQAGMPTYTFDDGHAAMDDEVWMVKGVDRSDTADTVDDIATRLDQLLTDGTITISSATQLYLRRESDVEYPTNEDGVQYKHAGATYRLIYEQT